LGETTERQGMTEVPVVRLSLPRGGDEGLGGAEVGEKEREKPGVDPRKKEGSWTGKAQLCCRQKGTASAGEGGWEKGKDYIPGVGVNRHR